MKAIRTAIEKARQFFDQEASLEDLQARYTEINEELKEARELRELVRRPTQYGHLLESGDEKTLAAVRDLDGRIRELKARRAAVSKALKERKLAAAREAARGLAARLPIRETAQAVVDAHNEFKRKSAQLQRLTSELADAQRKFGAEVTGYVPASSHGLVRQAARLSARPTVSSSEMAPPSWGKLKRPPPQKGPEIIEIIGPDGSTWIRRHPDGREEQLEGPPPGTPRGGVGMVTPRGVGEVA